jgi:hypothetical protein
MECLSVRSYPAIGIGRKVADVRKCHERKCPLTRPDIPDDAKAVLPEIQGRVTLRFKLLTAAQKLFRDRLFRNLPAVAVEDRNVERLHRRVVVWRIAVTDVVKKKR